MTQLYIINGFLGAGKTTLLKNLIKLYNDKSIAVIVNEYGKEDIDGEILNKKDNYQSVVGGSVFCSCKEEQFESAIKNLLKNNPDIIFVEASGLSDPTNMRNIIKNLDVEFKLSICVVDSLRVLKLLETAPVCRKQIMCSDILILNKTDLTSDTKEIIKKLEFLCVDSKIYETSYCSIYKNWLEKERNIEQKAAFITRDVSLVSKMISLKDNLDKKEIEEIIKTISTHAYRLKGFIKINGESYLVDGVEEDVKISKYPIEEHKLNKLVVLSGYSKPISKTLKELEEKGLIIIN